MTTPAGPPTPPEEPFSHTEHGIERPDPYHWMRRLDGPVLAHLDAERDWYDLATAHLAPSVQRLRSEMTARVPTTDSSVSWAQHGYAYYTRIPEGREYVQLLRRGNTGAEEVLLDLNELAEGHEYAELGLWSVSPDGATLAWSVDFEGDEVYVLRFRSLATGVDLPDVVERSYYGGAWSADSATFFHTVHDAAYRPHEVWRHTLGGASELVLSEPDERFELSVRATRSGAYVVIWSESRDTSEVWVVPSASPGATPVSVGGRRAGVEYHVEHHGDSFLVVTDLEHPEFAVMTAPVSAPTQWTPARAPDPGERLERVEAFATHVVLASRADGHPRLRLLPADSLAEPGVLVDPVLPTGSVALSHNEEFGAAFVTVRDESWLTPPTWSDVPLATGVRAAARHATPAPGHDPSAYVASVVSFPAPDGHLVPATVLRHASTPLDGTAPCLLYGYGAYEAVFESEWDPALPSLLDRGVVYVHTHLRGGGEGGRAGWLDGRLERKQHTFDDHLAVARGLAGLVDPARIATRGLSAGGLLQGAVFSQAPSVWRAVVAEVPFVDVVTTMLDRTIPLTVNEWDEWGDPSRPADHAWMAAYSPYDNPPPAGERPDLLVTGAVHDARVMVFEPAKWVARLRATDPAWAPRCLFRVETGAGAHAGPAGRFAHLAYEAEVYAWLLDRLGLWRDDDAIG